MYANASVGTARNINDKCWSINTCMHFKYNSYSHYFLGQHNVIKSFAAASKQSKNSNRQQCSQGPVCVHKSCSKAGNVNKTLTYQLQSGLVPGQGANTGPRLQLHAV